MLEYTNTKLQ